MSTPTNRQQLVDVAGQRLNVLAEARTGAPWIVFSNSLATNLHLWDLQVSELRAHFSILRYDYRGHGGSERSSGEICNIDRITQDLIAVMEYAGVERACHVGVSMGGVAGVAAAAISPLKFSSVIVCNARLQSTDDSSVSLLSRAERAQGHGMQKIVDVTLQKWFGSARIPLPPDARETLAGMIAETDPDDFSAYARGMSRYDVIDQLTTLNVPVRFLVGTDDGATSKDLLSISSRLPGAQSALIEGAGHLPNIQVPDRFNMSLLRLIS